MAIDKSVQTMIALLHSNTAITGAEFNRIRAEFNQMKNVVNVSPIQRRRLLKVLHASRALDTTLKSILTFFSLRSNQYSLGQYIDQFASHNDTRLVKLSHQERIRYKRNIADVRNLHLHNADSYPRNDSDIDNLIFEMHSLLSRILAL